jgi:hypothetical protein
MHGIKGDWKQSVLSIVLVLFLRLIFLLVCLRLSIFLSEMPPHPTFNASLHMVYTIPSKFTYIKINCFLY